MQTVKLLTVLLLHAAVFSAVYWFAFALRNEFQIAPKDWPALLATLPGILVIKLIIFYYMRQCHRSFYSVSFSDLMSLFHSATISALLIFVINGLLAQNIHPPRGVRVMDWALTILALGALRATGRAVREELRPRLSLHGFRRVADRESLRKSQA